jgi:hypothetical protein
MKPSPKFAHPTPELSVEHDVAAYLRAVRDDPAFAPSREAPRRLGVSPRSDPESEPIRAIAA